MVIVQYQNRPTNQTLNQKQRKNSGNNFFLRRIEENFRKITVKNIGEAFYEVLIFYLRNEAKKPPFEILLEDPASFYISLRRLLGVRGAKVYLKLIIKELMVEKNSQMGSAKINIRTGKIISMIRQGRKVEVRKVLVELLQ